MQAPASSPYYKANCIWPVDRGPTGWIRKTLTTRIEAAVRHLMLTPKGSFKVDPNYGTTLYRMRAQTVTEEKRQLIKMELQQALLAYAPDVLLHSMETEMDLAEQRLKVTAAWTIRGAQTVQHMDLGKPRETTVLL